VTAVDDPELRILRALAATREGQRAVRPARVAPHPARRSGGLVPPGNVLALREDQASTSTMRVHVTPCPIKPSDGRLIAARSAAVPPVSDTTV
jgi:hypothetical protein